MILQLISSAAHHTWPCCFVGRQQQDTLGQQGQTVFGQRTASLQSSGPVFGSGHQVPGTFQTGQTPFGRPHNTSSVFGNNDSSAAGATLGSQQQQQPGIFTSTGTDRELPFLQRQFVACQSCNAHPLSSADWTGASTSQAPFSIALVSSCSTVLISKGHGTLQVPIQQVRLLLRVGPSTGMSKQGRCQMIALVIHGSHNNSSGVTSQSSLPRLKCVDRGNYSRSGKLFLSLAVVKSMWIDADV